MTILKAGFAAGCAFVRGCVLLASGLLTAHRARRQHPDLTERLLPHRQQVADEIGHGLRQQSR